ncbi:MAG: ATP-binding protein [Pseudomonadales bacterium]
MKPPREHARVDVYTQQEGHDKVSIRVVDAGAGLSEDALQQVFAPFFSTKAAGMGMGHRSVKRS